MDKFILERGEKKDGYKMLNVRSGSYEILQQLKEDSGVPMADIVEAMVRFCAERVEIKEER